MRVSHHIPNFLLLVFKNSILCFCAVFSACSDGDSNYVIPKTSDTLVKEPVADAAQLQMEPINASALKLKPNPDSLQGFIKYIIPKGAQFSQQNTPTLVNEDSLVFEVIFDSSAIYTTVEPENQADINKLFGFSDCSTLHHENSARFGWRYYQNKLELLAYCYSNATLAFKSVSSIQINKKYTCTIVAKATEYIFYLEGKNPISMQRGCSEGFQFRLYPYFGGTEVAPQEVSILIKKIH